MYYKGLLVRVRKPVPRMQLSKDVPVSPEFRDETNKWMRDFFGVESPVPDGFLIKGKTVEMSESMFDFLKNSNHMRLRP